jgi:Tn3 transposase DDE domain-containing protein
MGRRSGAQWLYGFSGRAGIDQISSLAPSAPLIAGRINVALIRAHWSEILRVAASIRTGSVTASLILRQLASYPRRRCETRRSSRRLDFGRNRMGGFSKYPILSCNTRLAGSRIA